MNIQEITEAPVGSTMTITRDGGADEWVRQEGDLWMNPGSRVTLASTFFETPAREDRVTFGPVVPTETPGLNLPWYTIERPVSGIPAGRYQAWTQPGNRERLVVFAEGVEIGWILTPGAVIGAPAELMSRRCWWLDERHLTLAEPETVVCPRQHADDVPDVVALDRESAMVERARLQQLLHEYMDEYDYDRDSSLERWMESRMGMEARPAQRETITVSVNIRGYTDIDLGDSDLCPHIDSQDRVSVDSTEVRAHWDWSVDVDVDVDEGDCGCDDVEDEQVREALRREDINFTDFEVETCGCPND